MINILTKRFISMVLDECVVAPISPIMVLALKKILNGNVSCLDKNIAADFIICAHRGAEGAVNPIQRKN